MGQRLRFFLGYLLGLVMWLYARTFRITVLGNDNRLAVRRQGERPIVYAILHEQQLQAIATNPERWMVTMASRSKDGDFVAAGMRLFRVQPARGSSSRGGATALGQIVDWVRQGASATITCDGPRGPRRVAKGGIVQLARTTGAPLIPAAIVAERAWHLRSWDCFEVAKPFSRVVHVFGPPLWIGSDEDFDSGRARVTEALAALDREARAYLALPADPPFCKGRRDGREHA